MSAPATPMSKTSSQQCLSWVLAVRKLQRPAAAVAGKPRSNLIRFLHDAIDQLPYCRNVPDETCYHAARPSAGVHIAVFHDTRNARFWHPAAIPDFRLAAPL